MVPSGRPIGVEITAGTDATKGHVWVCDTRKNPHALLQVGDWLVRINDTVVHGQSLEFCTNLLRAAGERKLWVTREARLLSKSQPQQQGTAAAFAMGGAPKPPPALVPRSDTCPPNVPKPPLKKPAASKAQKPDKKKKKKQSSKNGLLPIPDELPDPGTVDMNHQFYCTLNNDTLADAANKTGSDWKDMAALNGPRYGPLKARSVFRPYTMLQIPAKRSAWKMKQLTGEPPIPEEQEKCQDCGVYSNPAEMLLCDGCDSIHHVRCVGLTAVPETDWFCSECVQVLDARRAKYEIAKTTTTVLPAPLPPLPVAMAVSHSLKYKLRNFLTNRRAEGLRGHEEICAVSEQAWSTRKGELQRQIVRQKQKIATVTQHHFVAQRRAMRHYGVAGWNLPLYGDGSWIDLSKGSSTVRLQEIYEKTYQQNSHRPNYSSHWQQARDLVRRVSNAHDVTSALQQKKRSEDKLRKMESTLKEEEQESMELEASFNEGRLRINIKYAALIGEGRLENERMSDFKSRESPPRYLGRIQLLRDSDVIAMHMLREPDEHIILVPEGGDVEPAVGASYSVFARSCLFDKKRDDALNLDKNGVRDAQRCLYRLLVASNQNIVVAQAALPPTVKERTQPKPTCFDLAELVRDCDVDLDLPQEPTPPVLAKHGLQLRDYQKSSLRWLLDKEMEGSGLGLAGELWHRLRFMDEAAAISSFVSSPVHSHWTFLTTEMPSTRKTLQIMSSLSRLVGCWAMKWDLVRNPG